VESVIKKVGLGAFVGAGLFTWILKSDQGMGVFLLANFCVSLVFVLGGHFLERLHISSFEPKLIAHPVENRTVRIMIWLIGGGFLFQGALLIWQVFGSPQFEGFTFWMGGVAFTLFQLAILHPVMTLLRLNNFYNNKG